MKHLANLSQNNTSISGPSPHGRHDSTHSIHNDLGHHGGPGPNRGGFQGGRGRGYANNAQFTPGLGYPPPAQPYPRGPGGQGRGNISQQFQQRGQMPFPNSPQPGRASPHIPNAMPNTGTPHMQPAMPVPGAHGAGYQQPYHYGPPGGFPPQGPPVNVQSPPLPHDPSFFRSGKKKGARRDAERFSSQARQHPDSSLKRLTQAEPNGRSRRPSKRWEATEDAQLSGGGPQVPQTTDHLGLPEGVMLAHMAHPMPRFSKPLDDMPLAGRNFDRLLTARQQNYAYGAPYDPLRPMVQQYQQSYGMPPFMNSPSQSPSPAFPAPFAGGQYGTPGQPMSRNPSQVSERPNSGAGQAQAPGIVQGGAPPSAAAQKPPAVVSSQSNFQRPQRKAITIKDAQGNDVNFKSLKAPASPAPAAQHANAPPVVASTPTPTPPPKPATPSHSRTESTAAPSKTAEEVQAEFKERVLKTKEVPAEPKAVDQAAATTTTVDKPAEAEGKADEPVKVEEKSDVSKPVVAAESKDKVETPTEASATPIKEAEKPKPAEVPAAAASEEDELERMIREMEEEDARREAKAKEYAAEKAIRDAEAKKLEEEQRIANAAEEDRKLKEAERDMERQEEERERRREAGGGLSLKEALGKKPGDLTPAEKESAPPTPDSVAAKLGDLKISSSAEGSTTASPAEPATSKPATEKQRTKPSALNLAPLNTKAVEPPQPSAALQSLKTARFLLTHEKIAYPAGINSPNPALNTAVTKKGNFKYDPGFLLQFKNVFTEKPSLDFDVQVKSLLGEGDGGSRSARTPAGAGPGRQNSRSAAPGFPAMGSFGAGQKPLPPGTTSAERFAMSSGTMARPNLGPMASFGRPGTAFPGPSQMSRTPSSSNMGMPNSPRQGSRSTRGGSKRDGYNPKAEAQAAKTMPLTQGQEVKALVTSTTGWKPMSVSSNKSALNPAVGVGPSGLLDPQTVQRKVKAALNKMTPENFDRISDQILVIAMQSKDEEDGRTLRQVIQLTFEKATDEAHWASMYAKFCKRMLETMSPEIRDTTILDKSGNVVFGGALFRKYLLNRCQEEFERGWKVDLPKPKEGESKEAVMLSDEYYEAAATKRRGLGLVQFIGELYKLSMLTERIMHQCVHNLLDYQTTPDEAEIESLSKLLRTIGANLDSTEKSKGIMDAYFVRIQGMMDVPELPSRLKFMLLDIIDLRKRHWISNETNKGPKTLEEVRQEAEAAAAAKAAEAARQSQRGPAGRPTMGRGDARQFSYNQPPQNQVGMDDLRRLKGSATRMTSANVTLGPQSMFASRSNSGRRGLHPGGALGRAGEDSGASSRTGTPPTRDPSTSNAFQ